MASSQKARKIILNMGIALNREFFFDANFGKTLGLDCAEPDIVIKVANELSGALVEAFLSEKNGHTNQDDASNDREVEVRGLVQFGGESIFLYQDEEIADTIASMSINNSYYRKPIWPFIHCPNPAWPETPVFLETMRNQFQLASKFHAPAVVAHLNAKEDSVINPNDIFERTIEALTNPTYLEIVKNSGVVVNYENNHHNSYFGLPENNIRLYRTLYQKLREAGHEDLIRLFGFCLDIGHFFTQMHKSGRNVEDQLKQFLMDFNHNITCFHLHTNSGNWDDHIIPIDFTDVLIPNIEAKYDPFFTQKHTELLWKYLHYWAEIRAKGLKTPEIERSMGYNENKRNPRNFWFIFEMESPYTIDQVRELGHRLAMALQPIFDQ